MKNRKMIALLLVSSLAATVFCGSAYAGRRVKPIAEQLAERAILETPQEKTLRLGEDGKPRVIITSDLEIDDDERNLFITTWGGFNTVARAFLSIYETAILAFITIISKIKIIRRIMVLVKKFFFSLF